MEQQLLNYLNQTLASPALDLFMTIVTDYGLLALPVIGLMLYFSRLSTQTRRLGSTLLIAQLFSLILTFVFYYLALRQRPDVVRLISPQPNFPSFPSGHTVLAFASTTVLTLFAWRGKLESFWWKVAVIGVGTLASLIGISRIYLGHHFPTDVIAGAVLGCATGASTYGLRMGDDVGVRRLRWLLWLQIAVAILVTMMAYLNILPTHLLRWPYADKVLHFLLFGSITFWLYLWWPNLVLPLGKWAVPVAILLPITIAFLEELLQGLSPLRTASLTDLAFDLAGMICFYLLARWLLRRECRA